MSSGDREMPPQDRATHAEALRRNPLLTELLKQIRDDCLATWMSGSGVAQREEQWMRLQVLRDFEDRVQRALDDGKLADGRKERARRADAMR
jgi:hypothetical protein